LAVSPKTVKHSAELHKCAGVAAGVAGALWARVCPWVALAGGLTCRRAP
jgi:hypothetical protein